MAKSPRDSSDLETLKASVGRMESDIGHRGLIRICSYAVAGVLATLMLSAVVPPIVADQSDRAVVNAPVTLLTAPVTGEVQALSVYPGRSVASGEKVARILNSRVDRSTLIALEGKSTETSGRALAASEKQQSNATYMAALDSSIQEQSTQLALIFRQQINELQARLAASESTGQEKKSLVDRQAAMVARNVASPEMLRPAQQQLDFFYFPRPHLGATAWAILAATGWNPFTGQKS